MKKKQTKKLKFCLNFFSETRVVGEYRLEGSVKWFNLTNVRVVESSNYRVILKRVLVKLQGECPLKIFWSIRTAKSVNINVVNQITTYQCFKKVYLCNIWKKMCFKVRQCVRNTRLQKYFSPFFFQ